MLVITGAKENYKKVFQGEKENSYHIEANMLPASGHDFTVWNSDGIPERYIFEKLIVVKYADIKKKYEKLPSKDYNYKKLSFKSIIYAQITFKHYFQLWLK